MHEYGDDARVTRDNDRRADDSVHGVLPRESAARPPTIGNVRFLRLATRDPTASHRSERAGDHLGTTRDVIFDTEHSTLLFSSSFFPIRILKGINRLYFILCYCFYVIILCFIFWTISFIYIYMYIRREKYVKLCIPFQKLIK